ncbi:hypothetical protein Sipo8835_27320 [Streptomyces ipomoeae]|uniref:Uncharacterized protein n=2 Tax=Streptomyces ipomoeae TaxID=103232 RepID=L1L800_9ACTN|nr:hypothetical protein [Streptomyces ipomoeae]EKX69176.1 hypothetical protein STRIP9103_05024 [Streptomyces ipomoeae 91-03]MDX2696528.1 hypothetical protein [Streptomyces ipomoeae]MDX2824095.1 hypothetical protein [Streptomyces ipomoeae]MDX2842256.1 hypothetical protein [Streptomyces ipomoeae]MDX2875209.1 hypothetical protein [Streptomyces ipomoeae]
MDRRTRARVGTGAVVAVTVLALGGLQGASAGTQTVEDVSSPAKVCVGTGAEGSLAGHGVPEDTPLDRTLAYVDELAYGRHADVFTGLVVDEDGRAAEVYRIPAADFDAAVCGAAEKGVTVRLYDRDINEKDLNALSDLISEDMTRWDGTFQLREVGLDGTGHVHIGVDDPGTAEPILRKAVGERNAKYLRVEYAPQAELL